MKKTGAKKFEIFTNYTVNIFFFIAILVCCIVMIYSLFVFINSCNDSKERITELANSYMEQQVVQTSVGNITENMDVLSDNNERFIDYTMKLQELESKSASTNILTFIYTFLSGTLIGVATYFTKKSSDSVNQIKANKELIENLDVRILYSNFCMHTQQLYSTIQIFSISLDEVIIDHNADTFINKYLPRLNVLINDFKNFAEKYKNDVGMLSDLDKNSIITELNEIGNLINALHFPDNNSVITNDSDDITRTEWKNQLNTIKKILK